jgi:hypothetical protein
MTSYILNRLTRQKWVVFSWGFNSPVAINNGLIFSVNGFVHKGLVEIVYNEGTDYFDIKLIKKNESSITIPDVAYDKLIEVIDTHVERVSDYEKRVKKEYSFLS